MKYAADFRQEARAALQGKWPLAILVGLVAAILGGATSGGPEFKINFTGGSLNANIQYAGQTIYSWGDGITPGLRAVLVGGAIYLILAAIVLGVLYFILGSVIEVGYARFNLNLTAGEKIPMGASLTLMVGDGAGSMEKDSTDVAVDTETPVTSESSSIQEDSWF